MYELTVESTFDAAHRLPDHPGKCKNLHGHTFRVRATVVAADVVRPVGYAVDFGVLKRELERVLARLDHACLNDVAPFDREPPTSELIARHVFEALSPSLAGLSAVTVFESEDAWATYRPDR